MSGSSPTATSGFASAILETPLYIGFRLFCAEAWAEIRNATHPDTPGPATLTVQWRDGTREVREYPYENAVVLNLEAFAAAVRGEAEYPFTDAQKIGNVAVMEAIARSAATGEVVRLAA
jgi:predicted dehydrogenase